MVQERIDRRTFLKITTICCAAGSLPGCDEAPIPGPVLPASSPASLDLQRWVQAAQVQNCPLWCWAASASMIIGYNGFSVSQERIVRDTYGSLICTTGTSTLDLPRKSGRVRDKNYAACCNCTSYSAGLT